MQFSGQLNIIFSFQYCLLHFLVIFCSPHGSFWFFWLCPVLHCVLSDVLQYTIYLVLVISLIWFGSQFDSVLFNILLMLFLTSVCFNSVWFASCSDSVDRFTVLSSSCLTLSFSLQFSSQIFALFCSLVNSYSSVPSYISSAWFSVQSGSLHSFFWLSLELSLVLLMDRIIQMLVFCSVLFLSQFCLGLFTVWYATWFCQVLFLVLSIIFLVLFTALLRLH